MTIEEIKKMIAGKQYDFLRTNPHLSGKIIFLTLGGSYAYGTNVDTSDVDVRGCAINSRSDILGLTNFEQFVNTQTDTTVYSFNKLVNLLINCNPNTIELLGCKPEHYFFITDIGREMIDNRNLFLSQRAVHSFGGYATQQLHRLENALARDKLSQSNCEKLTGRNHKKDDNHLNKHAMHLIRLYLMCFDILEKEEINTYREKDRDFLLSIRNGAFQNEDGSYKPKFFDIVSEYDKRLKYAKENTSLPKQPDLKRIEEFVMSVNSRAVKI